MCTQHPRQLSLIDIVNWYTEMLHVVDLLKNTDVQSKLKEIIGRGKFYAEALSGNLEQEIEQYLQQNQPFEWNRNQPNNSDEVRVNQDWEGHDNLTLFAMLLDSKELLKRWGVDYPLGADGPGLADPSKKYITALEAAKNECEVDVQKDYYDYLINQLKSHPGMA